MAIMIPVARFLLRQHKLKPITGRGLLVGVQTTPLSKDEAVKLIADEGVPLRPSTPVIDKNSRYSDGRAYITDKSFFAMFCDAEFVTLDVTDYEGAEIVHDMHKPLPPELTGKFDFVLNGSCLDNMFDPAEGMRNTIRLLKPGGRAVFYEMGSIHNEPFLAFSQGWFSDFFAVNNFADAHVYSCVSHPNRVWDGPYEVYAPKGYPATSKGFPIGFFRDRALINLAIAETGPETTTDKLPIQHQYRPDHAVYEQAAERFQPQPIFTKPFGNRRDRGEFRHLGDLMSLVGAPMRNPYPWVQQARKAFSDPLWVVRRAREKLRV